MAVSQSRTRSAVPGPTRTPNLLYEPSSTSSSWSGRRRGRGRRSACTRQTNGGERGFFGVERSLGRDALRQGLGIGRVGSRLVRGHGRSVRVFTRRLAFGLSEMLASGSEGLGSQGIGTSGDGGLNEGRGAPNLGGRFAWASGKRLPARCAPDEDQLKRDHARNCLDTQCDRRQSRSPANSRAI